MGYPIPSEVLSIIACFEQAGYEIYPVGGCVRDLLLGTVPHDWDLTTSATPEEMLSLLSKERVLTGGIKHGTVTLIKEHTPYEITTFRADGEYSDARRPDTVTFSRSLEEDVCRRDFTCNALCLTAKGEVLDLVGGISDLRGKKLRAIGNPDQRFSEDALRILRALRFSARLGFCIENETAESMLRNRERLLKLSKERVTAELQGIFTAQHVMPLLESHRAILEVLFPAWQGRPDYEEMTKLFASLPSVFSLRLAAFLRPMGAQGAQQILWSLKVSKRLCQRVMRLICDAEREIPDRRTLKILCGAYGAEYLEELFLFQSAIMKAAGESAVPTEKLQAALADILEKKEAVCLRDLAIGGRDLQLIGIDSGKEIGELLELLLDQVLSEQLINERETLLEHALFLKEKLRKRN